MGFHIEIQDIEMKLAFEDRRHERHQVTLKVHGEEFKGFVHEGEIHMVPSTPTAKAN